MGLIKPNLPLVNKLLIELSEVVNMTLTKETDKDVILEKIKVIIKDLQDLNKIQKEILVEYNKRNKEFSTHLEEHSKEINLITETTIKYSEWTRKYLEYIENDVSLTDEFIEQGKNYEDIITSNCENPTRINHELINEVLSTYLQFKLTKRRRRNIWLNYQLFKLNILYRTILNILISTSIGFCIEKIISYIFPDVQDFYIAILFAILAYFTLEKYLGKKFSLFFWKLIQKQSLFLFTELDLYFRKINIGNQ